MNRNEYMKELRKLHPQYDCDLIEQVKTRYIASLEGQVKELRRALKALENENAIFKTADYEALRAEKLIYCAKCRDGIVADDDGICGVCAGAQDGVIESLQNKVAELEKSAVVWHKYPDEKPKNGHYCLCLFYDMEYMIEQYIYDEFSDAIDQSEITHWAYLPRPPREEA